MNVELDLPPAIAKKIADLALEAGASTTQIIQGIVTLYFADKAENSREATLVKAVVAAVEKYQGVVKPGRPMHDDARAKIDWEEVRRRYLVEQVTLRSLADEYGVSPSTIHRHL